MNAASLEMSPKKLTEIDEHIQERNRLEEEAPRYDVEYYVDADDDRDAVMKAHGLLMDDLGEKNHVVITTSVNDFSAPGDQYGVMITIAGEVRKHTFEVAEAAYLADGGNKHYLWCITDYEIPEEPEDSFEDSEYESFEEVELEFLR